MNCPWGKKAFSGYLESEAEWELHDAVKIYEKHASQLSHIPLLIDQGLLGAVNLGF